MPTLQANAHFHALPTFFVGAKPIRKKIVTFSSWRGCIGEMTGDDMELVRRYAGGGSEEAFATLVSRHVNLVYSVALRQVRDPHLAEEIAQTVFVILARKAGSLSSRTVISGWLCQTARYASAKALTMQHRRLRREQESYMQSLPNESAPEAWMQIAPLLDHAMSQLGEKDHNALVLRFFEGRNFNEVSAALRTSEGGAKMRVNRALEKLRKFFAKRGVTFSASVIAGAISAHSVQAAPMGLASSVTLAAVKGTAVTTSTLTLIETTLKLMAWTKIKSAVVIGAIAVMAAGTATITVHNAGEAAEASPFKFAGYATPEASIQTMVWALSTGDVEKFLACLEPLEAERFKNRQIAGKSKDQIQREAMALAKALMKYRITEKKTVSDDEVHVRISAPASDEGLPTGTATIILKRIGEEWKRAGTSA
jgi:RNA polymerase sigma factor (sigma-70 family)